MTITNIVTQSFAVVTAVLGGIGSLISDAIELIYDGTAFTPLGTLVLVAAAAPLAMALLNWVFSLFKKAFRAVKIGGGK